MKKAFEAEYVMQYTDMLYGWEMSEKLLVNGFEWVKKLSKFDKRFIKDYPEKSDKGYFLEVDVEYPNVHSVFIVIYHFYLKGINKKNVISLFVTYMTRKTMLCI